MCLTFEKCHTAFLLLSITSPNPVVHSCFCSVETDLHLGSKVRRGLGSAGCQARASAARPRGKAASTSPSHGPPRLPTLKKLRCTRKRVDLKTTHARTHARTHQFVPPCPEFNLQQCFPVHQDFFYNCWNRMVMSGVWLHKDQFIQTVECIRSSILSRKLQQLEV